MNGKNSWPLEIEYGHICHGMATVGNTENISNSKHKSQLSPENKIWRCGENMAPKSLDFTSPWLKRLGNCLKKSNHLHSH